MRLPPIVVGTTGDAFCFLFRGSGSIFGKDGSREILSAGEVSLRV